MSVYRYGKTNGDFLPSTLMARAQPVDPNDFTSANSYDLTKVIAHGTDPGQDSFVSVNSPTNYYDAGGSMVAWWRLNKDISATGVGLDSSGNDRSLGTGSHGAPPDFDAGDTPTVYVQSDSCGFSAVTQFLEAADADAFSFGNGTVDRPFSIACWVKMDTAALAKTSYLVSKAASGAVEYYFMWVSGRGFQLSLYDQVRTKVTYAAGAPSGTSSSIVADQWYHVTATYDGRGGTNAALGIKIYVDGADTTYTNDAPDPYRVMSTTGTPLTVASDFDGGGIGLTGNLADLAIWNKELTANDVYSLYNVKTAGAYRLVRRFDRISIDNDTRVLGVKTKSRGMTVSGLPPDVMDAYRQGIDLVTFKQLTAYISFKIRPNSGFITTVNDKDISRTVFDDTIDPVLPRLFFTGTLAITASAGYSKYEGGSKVSPAYNSGSFAMDLGGKGRVSARLSHEREYRDLGQSDVYINMDSYELFEDTLDLNPTAIITKDPDALILPRQLVIQTSNELNDGAIEPLMIRRMIDHTSIEQPFFAHDVRASLGGMTDAFRRSILIVDGRDLDEPEAGCAPFLDSTETFGAELWFTGSSRLWPGDTPASGQTLGVVVYGGGLDLPGSFSTDFATIEPYVDYLNDRDKEYTLNNISPAISNIMIHSASFEDADMRTYDKMAPAGFIFDNCPIGIDSVTYGGLKK